MFTKKILMVQRVTFQTLTKKFRTLADNLKVEKYFAYHTKVLGFDDIRPIPRKLSAISKENKPVKILYNHLKTHTITKTHKKMQLIKSSNPQQLNSTRIKITISTFFGVYSYLMYIQGL